MGGFYLRRDPIAISPRGEHSDEGIVWRSKLHCLVFGLKNALFSENLFIQWAMSSFVFLGLTSCLFLFPTLVLETDSLEMSSSQDQDHSGMEDKTAQLGFVKSVLQVFSGSRLRTPGVSKTLDSDPIRRDETGQDDRDHVSGSSPDEVLLTEEITDSTASLDAGPSYRYNDGSPALTHGGSSDGFRYFRNDAVGVDQGKGGISSPARGQSKTDKSSSDPSSFPLSRPVAGYVSTRDNDFFRERSEHLSVARMGQWDLQNVTQRDVKRPKERSRDKAYKQRFSMESSSAQAFRTNVVFQTSGSRALGAGNQSFKDTPAPSGYGHGIESGFPPSSPLRHGGSQYPDGTFEIFLIFNGGTTVHRVWDSMHVSQLITEAGTLFGVDPQDLALILLSGSPSSIPRTGRISGPPRIAPGSSVLVFEVATGRNAGASSITRAYFSFP